MSEKRDVTALPLTDSAKRIVADEGDWTKGDAKLCAEFVLAAQSDLHQRVTEAQAALAEGGDAVVAYLTGRVDLVAARSQIATFLTEMLNAAHAEHPGPFCPVCGLVSRLQAVLHGVCPFCDG